MKTYSSVPSRHEETRQVICNICQSKENYVKMYVGRSVFVQCPVCGLVYQNPQPVFKDLKKRYQDEYFKYEIENEVNFFNLMKLGLKDIGLLGVNPENFENPRFLDIGCATGMLCSYMQENGWEAYGIDICGPSCEYGRKNRDVNLINLSLEEAVFKDECFSFIHASHLIEHVVDPVAFLSEVYRIMSQNGIGVFTTPNISGFQARLFGSSWRSAIEDHLYLFNLKTFPLLLEKCGFKVLDWITWGGIAKGRMPDVVKRLIDKLAKKASFGDVMLFCFKKK